MRVRRRQLLARAVLPAALLLTIVIAGATASAAPRADAQRAEAMLREAIAAGSHVVLMRHALAPGVGDPSTFRVEDCGTQRNLSAAGRRQAQAIGARLRNAGARGLQVYSSRWCRSVETARLLGIGPVTPLPALDSFFARRASENPQTGQLRAFLVQRRGGPSLVLVTHQVNITALTGVFPLSGEILVLRNDAAGLSLVGRLPAPAEAASP